MKLTVGISMKAPQISVVSCPGHVAPFVYGAAEFPMPGDPASAAVLPVKVEPLLEAMAPL